jgi:uncharacterized damage-inducible protein DinB
MEVLRGVSRDKAAARPVAGAHTIWEIALHITAWAEIGRLRVSGTAVGEVAPEQDWPSVGEASEDDWRRTVDVLQQSEARLAEVVDGLSDAQLAAMAAGKPYSVYFLLHGVVQHNVYHAGQIALLKMMG